MLTGKGMSYGGSLVRKEATGYGRTWEYAKHRSRAHFSDTGSIWDVPCDVALQYGQPGNYVAGANIEGFLLVADAMQAMGVV